jgi:hypothetical protein
MLAGAIGHGRAAEIKGARNALARREAGRGLDGVGIVPLRGIADRRGDGGDVDGGIGQRRQRRANRRRLDRREIALNVDDDVVAARGIEQTNTGPMAAASARRSTWTIMGRPPISASGLPGSRVEASRAGITTMGRKAETVSLKSSRLKRRARTDGPGIHCGVLPHKDRISRRGGRAIVRALQAYFV